MFGAAGFAFVAIARLRKKAFFAAVHFCCHQPAAGVHVRIYMPAARARRAGAATRGQSICFVLSLLGVGGSCRAESFGGGGGLLVEDRSSWAKRINHLESFRLKISRCPVQLTVNYVLFVCTYTESTDRVFLRYRYGNYREIPTEYRPKIPNRYTTLQIWVALDCERGRLRSERKAIEK